MGRHSNGKSNITLSRGLIALIVAIVVIATIVFAWLRLFQFNSEQVNQSQCVAGNLTVPVVAEAGLEDLTQGLIDTYNSSNPVVRDYCATAELSFDLSKAAAYVTSRSDGGVHQPLEASGRSAATLEWPTVSSLRVGLAAPTGTTVDMAALSGDSVISYTPGTHALAAGLVAAKVNNLNTESMSAALTAANGVTVADAVEAGDDLITVTERLTPSGYTFHNMEELVLPVRVVALNPADGVSEELVRAGADFATNLTDPNVKTTVANIAAAEVLHGIVETPVSTPLAAPLSGEVATTLFLLDTSEALGAQGDAEGSWFSYATSAIAENALAVGREGFNVGLWNYSSPLTPGVVNGYRSNLYLGTDPTGQRTAAAVRAFGYGGEPYTRAALYAAVGHAVDFAAVIDQPVTVVLVSTGTTDEMDEAELTSLLERAAQGNVSVKVVEIETTNPSDATLLAATNGTRVASGTALTEAINQSVHK